MLRHPSYSAMMCESIRGVDREIMFMGSADVDVEGSSDDGDAAVSVTGNATGGVEDGVSSGGEGGSDDSGVVDWVSGSDGLFYGVHGDTIVGVEV